MVWRVDQYECRAILKVILWSLFEGLRECRKTSVRVAGFRFIYSCLFKESAIVLLCSVKRQDVVWYNLERM
jgi:hypothetical protein